MSYIDRDRFPHIDPNELSSRAGVDGPRYVEAPGFKDCLGDTNTGRIVHPQAPGSTTPHVFVEDDSQLRDQVAIASG